MSIVGEVDNANVLILGASQGIGLGFVKALLQDSQIVRIYATYRRLDSATALLALTEEHPDRLVSLKVDLTDETQVKQCVEQIHGQVDKLHGIINCVGVLHDGQLQPEKSLRQINAEYLMQYFQVNSISAVLLAKHVLPLLSHGDRNIFATISAKLGSIGDNNLGGWYGYRASKAALNMFMRTVAIEYRRKSPHTIVVTLHPGTTDTRLSRPFQKNVSPEKLFPIERTITQLTDILGKLKSEDSGEFFSWDGSRLPW